MRVKFTEVNVDENQRIVRSILNRISTNNRILRDITHKFENKTITWNDWTKLPLRQRSQQLNPQLLKQTLFLKSNNPPEKTLIKCFPHVKKVVIEFDPSNPFHLSIDKYKYLASLEHLIITRITQPIDFIPNQYLKSIFAVTPIELNGITIDIVEPLLRASTELQGFKYYGGVLNDNSLIYRRNNNLTYCYLNNVTITSEQLFLDFLSNCFSLRKLTLCGTQITQICFFSDKNVNIHRIERLHLYVHSSLMGTYIRISKCLNLRTLILSYTALEELLVIYYNVLELPYLRKIIISKYNNHSSIDEEELDTDYFSEWKAKFAIRNIALYRKQTETSLGFIKDLEL